MKTLREYFDILAEAETAPVWTPTPDQAKWLGGANQQDPYILSRMPGSKPPITHFTDPKDQALAKQLGFPAAPTAPAPAAPAVEPAQTQAVPEPQVQATELPAAPAAPANQGATPANRDSMTFSQAFADARSKGEPQFTWKGKSYTTQVKAAQGATPAKPPVNTNPAPGQFATNAGGAATGNPTISQSTAPNNPNIRPGSLRDRAAQANAARAAAAQPTNESVGYDEVQRIVSLVHYR